MSRLVGFIFMMLMVLSLSNRADARVGFGDPMTAYRERKADEVVVLDGYFRLRSAGYQNLNLVTGGERSPSGQSLWPVGSKTGDWTGGADMRMRLGTSLFVRDDLRFLLEVDVLDNLSLGSSPQGTPLMGRHGIVAGTASQSPLSLHDTLRLRVAAAEILTPFGVLSAGRSKSHFGLGIAANDGSGLDDDTGDLADRIAFTSPLFGHFFSVAYDWAAIGPSLLPVANTPSSPKPHLLSNGLRSISIAWLRYRAPWEVELYRKNHESVLDYGVALSYQWQESDVPAFYDQNDSEAVQNESLQVKRGYSATAVDTWVRWVRGAWRLEAEAIGVPFEMENASNQAGITFQTPVTGTPFGGTLVAQWKEPGLGVGVLTELGFASADSDYGFPFGGATAQDGGQAGDYFGSQLNGAGGSSLESFQFHPSYQVDLILWRTLLGGVSEAAFARTKVDGQFLETFTLESNFIYSHGLSPSSTPGGIASLGFEADFSASIQISSFSLRLDYGVLFPFGGLAVRGTTPNKPAQLMMVRLGYEAR